LLLYSSDGILEVLEGNENGLLGKVGYYC